jgi:Stress-induced morphogen (activity unknown)
MNVGRPVYTAITQKLTRALAPVSLVVVDESAAHAGHVGNPARGDPSAETHFKVEGVSDSFEGKAPGAQTPHDLRRAARGDE